MYLKINCIIIVHYLFENKIYKSNYNIINNFSETWKDIIWK